MQHDVSGPGLAVLADLVWPASVTAGLLLESGSLNAWTPTRREESPFQDMASFFFPFFIQKPVSVRLTSWFAAAALWSSWRRHGAFQGPDELGSLNMATPPPRMGHPKKSPQTRPAILPPVLSLRAGHTHKTNNGSTALAKWRRGTSPVGEICSARHRAKSSENERLSSYAAASWPYLHEVCLLGQPGSWQVILFLRHIHIYMYSTCICIRYFTVPDANPPCKSCFLLSTLPPRPDHRGVRRNVQENKQENCGVDRPSGHCPRRGTAGRESLTSGWARPRPRDKVLQTYYYSVLFDLRPARALVA